MSNCHLQAESYFSCVQGQAGTLASGFSDEMLREASHLVPIQHMEHP